MTTHFFGDTTVLLGRTMRHITRSPDTIITTTIMPIAFLLLFVYVFGGAINSGSDSYVNYLLPGILLITIASGIAHLPTQLETVVCACWAETCCACSTCCCQPDICDCRLESELWAC